MMRGMLSTMGLAAMLGVASATASPTHSAGQVVGHMQELNLEQVRDSPHPMHLGALQWLTGAFWATGAAGGAVRSAGR